MKKKTNVIIEIINFFSEYKRCAKSGKFFNTSLFCKLLYIFLFLPWYIVVIVSIHSQEIDIFDIFAIILSTYIFIIFPAIDVYGRHIIIEDGKIKQRTYFSKLEELDINSLTKCYVKTGIDIKEKRGYLTLRLESKRNYMNINYFYYKKQDLMKIVTLIGFPSAIK